MARETKVVDGIKAAHQLTLKQEKILDFVVGPL